MPKFHRNSTFGTGRVQPLDREQRTVWRRRIELARKAGRLTDGQANVALALIAFLGPDGRCDPSHQALAIRSGESVSTVKRALKALEAIGLVSWARRLIKVGKWRAEQTSNAYILFVSAGWSCDAHFERETPKRKNLPSISVANAEAWANAERRIALLLGLQVTA